MRRIIPFYIKQVLLSEKSVNVPGIGQLQLNHHAARIAENRSTISPPYLDLVLDNTLSKDDRLAHTISRREDVPVEKVEEELMKFGLEANTSLKNKGLFLLPGIGKIESKSGILSIDTDIAQITEAYAHLPKLKLLPVHDVYQSDRSVTLPPRRERFKTDLWPVVWGFLLGLLFIGMFTMMRGCSGVIDKKNDQGNNPVVVDTIGKVAEKRVEEPRLNTYGQIIPESGRCVIITGSLSKNKNILNMETLVGTKGYEVYTENYYQLTRVGIEFDCTEVDLEAFIQQVRQEIAPDAWYLDPRLEVPMEY